MEISDVIKLTLPLARANGEVIDNLLDMSPPQNHVHRRYDKKILHHESLFRTPFLYKKYH